MLKPMPERLVLWFSVWILAVDAFQNGVMVPEARLLATTSKYESHTMLRVAYLPEVCIITKERENKLDPKKDNETVIAPFEASVTKIAMTTYIASMCLALPLTLFPTWTLYKTGLISKLQREQLSLQTGQCCAAFLLQIMPFVNLTIISQEEQNNETLKPSIWCANHVSPLDTFLLLAADKDLRGKNRRQIKVIYWKGLDENPITKMLFHMAGFIPVQMADNGSGNPNEYDQASFKSMLKLTKQAFQDGFDILVLPEGQLNPNPEIGLLPVFPGAFTLAQMSKRPIRLAGIHGSHRLWHADDNIGMTVTGRDVTMRVYPPVKKFESATDFVETFNAVLGHFGATGQDMPEEDLTKWLGGND